MVGDKLDWHAPDGRISEAVAMARRSDAIVIVTGLNCNVEGEEGELAYDFSMSGDKFGLKLSGLQERLIDEIATLGKPTVLVNITGSAMDLTNADQKLNAVIPYGKPPALPGDSQ